MSAMGGEQNASRGEVVVYDAILSVGYRVNSRRGTQFRIWATGTLRDHLRQAIPFGGQGAFITTADYQGAAADVALEAGFPRIGLINGRQLVDLLIEHWSDIPPEFRERLGLKPGLVRT